MITKDIVAHIAKLAKIKLSEEKLEQFTKDLEGTLGFVEQLNEIDTASVKETAQVTGLVNVMRSDEIQLCEIEKELLASTPHEIENNSVRIPKIM